MLEMVADIWNEKCTLVFSSKASWEDRSKLSVGNIEDFQCTGLGLVMVYIVTIFFVEYSEKAVHSHAEPCKILYVLFSLCLYF
jgi:hypothetical protein